MRNVGTSPDTRRRRDGRRRASDSRCPRTPCPTTSRQLAARPSPSPHRHARRPLLLDEPEVDLEGAGQLLMGGKFSSNSPTVVVAPGAGCSQRSRVLTRLRCATSSKDSPNQVAMIATYQGCRRGRWRCVRRSRSVRSRRAGASYARSAACRPRQRGRAMDEQRVTISAGTLVGERGLLLKVRQVHGVTPIRLVQVSAEAVAVSRAALIVSRASSVRASSAAPRFSSRWATDRVPGMGSMTGDRCSSHASAS